MSRQKGDLDASCPDDGDFYVCSDSKIKFVGCCTIDPCKTNNGICPNKGLYPASFGVAAFDLIKSQDCTSSSGGAKWYTCAANDPPFMGCCSVNPCLEGECPSNQLIAAQLSSDEENAAVFLGGLTATSSAPGSTSTKEPTSTGTNPSDPSHKPSDDKLSKGAVIGIAVAGAIGGLLLLGLAILWYIKRRKTSQSSRSYEPYAGNSDRALHDSKLPSPYTPVSAGFDSMNSQQQQQQQGCYQLQAQGATSYNNGQLGSGRIIDSPYDSRNAAHTPAPFEGFQSTAAELSATGQKSWGAPTTKTSYDRLGRESEVSGQSHESRRRESYLAELDGSNQCASQRYF